VVCVDEADGSVVSPGASLDGLFMHIEHTLHATRGKQGEFTLPTLEVN
jgi:hypothetical protein